MFYLLLLLVIPYNGLAQRGNTLEEIIRLAQDSAITAFQSQYEYEYRQYLYDEFNALRKPQLRLVATPNYTRTISELDADYVQLDNLDIFSTSVQLKLTQKMLGWGGEAYLGTQAVWSEFFDKNTAEHPRQFAVTPFFLGYKQELLGYNSYRWEKAIQEQILKAAIKEHTFQLYHIAEEATRRFFRLACTQGVTDMCRRNLEAADTLYAIAKEKFEIAIVGKRELLSLELQRINAHNALETALNDEQVAKTELLSFLRLSPDDQRLGKRLSIPTQRRVLQLSIDQAIQLAKSNNPEYLRQKAELTEALQEQEKARKEAGINIGLDVRLGLQQVEQKMGTAFSNQQTFMAGAVSFSIPLMDYGAAQKRKKATAAWTNRQNYAQEEIERSLVEDVVSTIQSLQANQRLLEKTQKGIELANEVFELSTENYAHGITDINAYTLAQSQRDEAYNQHLSALERYWTTYYHLVTLTQYEF